MTEKKVVHRGYFTNRMIGRVYDGWRIVARRRIPRFLRWLYKGAAWAFIGVRER